MQITTHHNGHSATETADEFPVRLLGEGVAVTIRLTDGSEFSGRCYRAIPRWLALLRDARMIDARHVLRLDVEPPGASGGS